MFWSILVFLLVLSVLVLVHEFGHYWVAKRNGVWVEEFGFGLPPRVFGKKIGETLYSINLFPFGGFVRLHGEMNEDGVTKPKRAFLNKSLWVKTAVIIAGVIMNFLLAIVCFAIVYSFSGIPKDIQEVKVLDVSINSPAHIAQILVGDVIKKVDGQEVKSVAEFITKIEDKKGKKVVLEIDPLGDIESRKVTITPRAEPPEGEGPLGVSITNIETYYPPVWQRPFYGAYYGTQEAVYWGKAVVVGFVGIFSDLFQGQAPKDVSGPVGVFAITSEVAKTGVLSLINLVGIISVNLAILNIIPFPALDGGRLLFIVIEAVFGKKVAPKVEGVIHSIGMIILLLAILAITIKDIRGLISAGSISGFLNNMIK
ncbi:MAG: M50 family metallopeptidase [bacterium]|nr:MAG: M50 family metallopeptidase [bacterium]